MSAFQNLASPAPRVEEAVVESPADDGTEPLNVEPARPSDEAVAEAAREVGPAVPFDNPKGFAPPLPLEKASHLSVAALRAGTGADFESKVRYAGRTRRCLLEDPLGTPRCAKLHHTVHRIMSSLTHLHCTSGRCHQGKGGARFLSTGPTLAHRSTRFRILR